MGTYEDIYSNVKHSTTPLLCLGLWEYAETTICVIAPLICIALTMHREVPCF